MRLDHLLSMENVPNARSRRRINQEKIKDGENPRSCCSIFRDRWKKESVLLTRRVHPFPFRTRKLSCAVPKILYWRRYGKIGQGRHRRRSQKTPRPKKIEKRTHHGGVAQLGEHLPCKQGVMGSNPIISTSRARDDKWKRQPNKTMGS